MGNIPPFVVVVVVVGFGLKQTLLIKTLEMIWGSLSLNPSHIRQAWQIQGEVTGRPLFSSPLNSCPHSLIPDRLQEKLLKTWISWIYLSHSRPTLVSGRYSVSSHILDMHSPSIQLAGHSDHHPLSRHPLFSGPPRMYPELHEWVARVPLGYLPFTLPLL